MDWYTYCDLRPYAKDCETDCESINGCCFVIRRSFLNEIGLFDEGTFLYHEEIILGKQIKNVGKKACFVTTTTVIHNQGATTGHGPQRTNLKMMKYMIGSELHYCKKYLNASWPAISLLLCVRVIDILSKMLFYDLWKYRIMPSKAALL